MTDSPQGHALYPADQRRFGLRNADLFAFLAKSVSEDQPID